MNDWNPPTLRPRSDSYLERIPRAFRSEASATKLAGIARSAVVFLLTSFLVNLVSTLVVENTAIKIEPTQAVLLNVVIGAIVAMLFWVWDGGQHSLRQLTTEFRALEQKTGEAYDRGVVAVRDALLADSTARLYADLPTRVSDPLIGTYVRTLPSQDRLEARALSVGKEVSERLTKNNRWYPILNRFLSGEEIGLRDGRFSLGLETYLQIYLELMRLYIDVAREKGIKLHICSFTNAIPTDWLAGDTSIAGNIMARFAEQKTVLIQEMKEAGFVMRMVTLALEETNATVPGMRCMKDVRHAWASIGDANRENYLRKLHTENREACVAQLEFENLEFFAGMAEFIFFGFQTDDAIDWDLCIAGGYSSQNQVLLAQFLFLDSEARDLLLLDIPNNAHLKQAGAIATPKRIQVRFADWPNFVLRDHGYGAIKLHTYEGMVTFTDKWRLAAEIWHSDQERQQIATMLREVLDGKTEILDAAAGTGFHCEVLRELGRSVTALEVSQAELEILRGLKTCDGVATILGDWRTLSQTLGGRQFDAAICLGSSLPYHSSRVLDSTSSNGDGGVRPAAELDAAARDAILRTVIENLRGAVRPNGVLVLGLSRHNERSRTGVVVEYEREVNNVIYRMNWKFTFDWLRKRRIWNSNITGGNGEEYAFQIDGHLFDHDELSSICGGFFGRVEMRDIAPGHYDKYLLCCG